MTAPLRAAFWRGFRAGTPFVLGAAPFGLVFGIVGTEAGLDLAQVMGMTVLVIAGAAQFAALAQMNEAAPVLLVVAAGLAVNMRMAIYSASLAPHLGGAPLWQRALASYLLVDNAYVVSFAEYDARPDSPGPQKMAYYFGCALPVLVTWYLAAFLGAWFGLKVPPEYALDFAVPIAFIAIVAPMLRSLAHVAAALTSAIVALALAFMPYSTGLFIAAALALVAGSEVERRFGAAGPIGGAGR